MSGGFSFGVNLCGGTSYNVDGAHIFAGNPMSCGTSNAKGAWNQIIASTSADAAFIMVMPLIQGSNNIGTSIDIGIGPGGSEVVLLPDILFSGPGGLWVSNYHMFPVSIPAGTRIAARAQTASAGAPSMELQVSLFDDSFTSTESFAGMDTMGFVSASTQGTTIDPGASGSTTKGSYAQLVASTARDYAAIMVQMDSLNNTTAAGNRMNVDLAIGGAGSEVVIIPDLLTGTFGSGAALPWSPLFPIPISIPAGTRVAARAASENATAGTRVFGLTAYGFYR